LIVTIPRIPTDRHCSNSMMTTTWHGTSTRATSGDHDEGLLSTPANSCYVDNIERYICIIELLIKNKETWLSSIDAEWSSQRVTVSE
jgi:hypothetical protein